MFFCYLGGSIWEEASGREHDEERHLGGLREGSGRTLEDALGFHGAPGGSARVYLHTVVSVCNSLQKFIVFY